MTGVISGVVTPKDKTNNVLQLYIYILCLNKNLTPRINKVTVTLILTFSRITYGITDFRCTLSFYILVSENLNFFYAIFAWKQAISLTIIVAGVVLSCVYDLVKLQFFIARIFWILKIITGLNVFFIELLSSWNKDINTTVTITANLR